MTSSAEAWPSEISQNDEVRSASAVPMPHSSSSSGSSVSSAYELAPSGSSPWSSGRRRTARASGRPITSTTTPDAKAAVRQPMLSMTSAMGVAAKPPIANPIESIPRANERRRRNQFTTATTSERKLLS